MIDRLKPQRSESRIILSDPQRKIRTGAPAVDGWATENGFTLLFLQWEPRPAGEIREPAERLDSQAHPGGSHSRQRETAALRPGPGSPLQTEQWIENSLQELAEFQERTT